MQLFSPATLEEQLQTFHHVSSSQRPRHVNRSFVGQANLFVSITETRFPFPRASPEGPRFILRPCHRRACGTSSLELSSGQIGSINKGTLLGSALYQKRLFGKGPGHLGLQIRRLEGWGAAPARRGCQGAVPREPHAPQVKHKHGLERELQNVHKKNPMSMLQTSEPRVMNRELVLAGPGSHGTCKGPV